MVANMNRLQQIVDELPEATRVDIEAWDGQPTFRVRGKNFVFTDVGASRLTLKLPVDEAEAVVATETDAEPAGYGLGRHGWVSLAIPLDASTRWWAQLREWVRTSYVLVAPKTLARLVLAEDGVATTRGPS
ncbi:MmcQ/YjbR family DNA-binding protein [Rhodococcus sp. ABRD24]|uniref:MmcQ/YjbR family DNA-binding protein n=1 Tax=Rhodococcus sp. ABRD24 TaxID=2507582 RepID=UPI001038FC77|nr:MmcQ/YjbR family DNA-binding protein [Rhodococcus sp. ABRD24]QBJ97299.1 MmcQ/YjbR family DNA-binding protein [Rhodococcus sp. ABRD24]